MRKGPFSLLLSCAGFALALLSCRNDSHLADAPPVSDQSFVEQFDTMQNAYNRGWRWINRSEPIGTVNWMAAPGTAAMSAYSSRGTRTGAAYATYESTSGTNDGIISNWLVSPPVTMQNGDRIIFFTKSELVNTGTDLTDFGSRLQVRINEQDDDLSMGNGDDPGKFSGILLDINPNEDEFTSSAPIATAYPPTWTRFEATVYGLSGPAKRRFAFRYYLHGAGSNGAGSGIGIDSVAYVGRR